jgi:general secretion pathway protein H
MNRAGRAARNARRRPSGFTLLELLVVIFIIAIAAGLMTLSLRDAAESRLEEEGARLAALFDSARAIARTADAEIRWQPVVDESGGTSFRFTGLPPGTSMSSRWIGDQVSAEVVGAPFVRLGPDPVIGEQHVILRIGNKRTEIATDGLGPFVKVGSGTVDEAAR